MMRMPSGFVGHGSPTLALDAAKGAELAAWSRAMPRPAAVLVLSAHWTHSPPTLGTLETRELVYDFYGFPAPLYRLRYPAPGAAALADDVRRLLAAADIECAQDPARGLDHGVWVPLLHMYPDADVPVLQLSQPAAGGPQAAFALGRALAPLRDRGVLVLGSGSLVHNLGSVDFSDRSEPPPWARQFDQWCAATLESLDLEALLAYRERAPELRRAHPTEEHFTPLLAAAGAAGERLHGVSFPVTGFEFGTLSRRCVQFD